MLPSVALYTNLFRCLSNNEDILELLELSLDSEPLDKALKIQKRSKPQEIAKNIPMIAFYTPGGVKEYGNSEVYNSNFIFDCYTKDDPELAQSIIDRIYKLFIEDMEIPLFSDMSNFAATLVDAGESGVDLPNTYCFTLELIFSVSLT